MKKKDWVKIIPLPLSKPSNEKQVNCKPIHPLGDGLTRGGVG